MPALIFNTAEEFGNFKTASPTHTDFSGAVFEYKIELSYADFQKFNFSDARFNQGVHFPKDPIPENFFSGSVNVAPDSAPVIVRTEGDVGPSTPSVVDVVPKSVVDEWVDDDDFKEFPKGSQQLTPKKPEAKDTDETLARKKAILEDFLLKKGEVEKNITRWPTLDERKKFDNNNPVFKGNIDAIQKAIIEKATKGFYVGPQGVVKLQDKCNEVLENYRELYGVQKIEKRTQDKLLNELPDIIPFSTEILKNYKPFKTSRGETLHYFVDEKENRLVIVHPQTCVLHNSDDRTVTAQQDAAAKKNAIQQMDRDTKELIKELIKNIPNANNFSITHIVPEVGAGRLRYAPALSNETKTNSQHIRLQVVEQEATQLLAEAYKKAKTHDPRDVGLGGQSTFNDIDCGRHVAAMVIQAAGLSREGLPVTQENLKASPSIERAKYFNDVNECVVGLKNTYVRPLTKDALLGDVIAHNLQKIQCVTSGYEARTKHIDKTYHVGFFSQFGFTAEEKLKAAREIEKRITEAASKSQKINLEKLPKAAEQGELGKCVAAIREAQSEKAYNSFMQNRH